MHSCYRCGLPILFRMTTTTRDGRRIRRRNGRPYAIHVGGRCGQLVFPFIQG
jgi:hypothetical protein